MAYCRHGEDSEAYIWDDGKLIQFVIRSKHIEHDFAVDTAKRAYELALEYKFKKGVKIPDYALQALESVANTEDQ